MTHQRTVTSVFKVVWIYVVTVWNNATRDQWVFFLIIQKPTIKQLDFSEQSNTKSVISDHGHDSTSLVDETRHDNMSTMGHGGKVSNQWHLSWCLKTLTRTIDIGEIGLSYFITNYYGKIGNC